MKNKLIVFLVLQGLFFQIQGVPLGFVNRYRKPIQLFGAQRDNLGRGVNFEKTVPTGGLVKFDDFNAVIFLAIKGEGALAKKHLLASEFAEIKEALKNDPQIKTVLLTIPDTSNILKWKPGIINTK